MEKLREVLAEHALTNPKNEKQESTSVFHRISIFEEELKARLSTALPLVREAYDNKGISPVRNRIQDCRTYPLYKFVRAELGTQLLSGLRPMSPGQEIEKVYDAICQGKLVAPLLQCVEGWTGAPGPFPPQTTTQC
jgi:phenylalanine ammonia-lyase